MADIKVRVGQQNSVKVTSALIGKRITLSDLIDVNADPLLLSDGMVLVYNGSTSQWDATLELTPGNTQNLNINGGSF
jgi:hypothetical protein